MKAAAEFSSTHLSTYRAASGPRHARAGRPELFDRAGEILQTRAEELKGRQWHTHSERLVTGIIRCALCKRAMVGVSGTKKGRKVAYYACNDRDGDLTRAQDQLDRYYRAFEGGTMNSEACGSRLEEINAQVAALRARRAVMDERLTQLAMPALDLKEVADLMDDFESVFESGLNAQKKHLLHRLVKEVRVQSRDTAEVWYQFPRPAAANGRTVDSHIWLGGLVSVRTAQLLGNTLCASKSWLESPYHR